MLTCLLIFLSLSSVSAQDCTACPSCVPEVNPEFPSSGDLSSQGCAAKIVFLLDESGSLGNFRSDVTSAATAFWTGLSTLNGLGGSARLGLIEFADTARVVQGVLRPLDGAYVDELNTYINSQQAGIQGYSPSGTTDWGEALALANSAFTGENSPDIVVFFTDGEPNGHDGQCDADCYPFDENGGDLGNACFEADKLKARGIKIFTVAVGDVVGNLPAIQVISGGSVTSVPFGAGARQWDFSVETFGISDYIVDPAVANLEQRLSAVASALCQPVCLECSIEATNPNPPSLECSSPDPPSLEPLMFTQTGQCGEPAYGISTEGVAGPCRSGSVTLSVSLLDTCHNENEATASFTTFITDTMGPEVVCPPSELVGSCPEALDAINTLTTTATDACSEVTLSKSEVTPIFMNDQLEGYSVSFSAVDGCGNPGNTCVVQYTCDAGADLEITKSSDRNPRDCAVAGDSTNLITYTIKAHNLGPGTSKDVEVTEVWPVGGGVLQNQGDIVPSVGTFVTTVDGFTWNVGDLSLGEEATITFQIYIDASFPEGFIENTARGSSPTPDPNLCNNVDTHEVRVCRQSDLSVVKLGQEQHTAGEQLDGVDLIHGYAIRVCNAGPSDADNVQFFDEWPTGYVRRPVQQCGGAVCSANSPLVPGLFDTFHCTWTTLPAGSCRTVVVPYSVPCDVLPGCNVNSVHVLSNSVDPTAENDHDDYVNCVRSEADLGVTKTDNTETATAGDGVVRTYEIELTNHGPSSAHQVRLVDVWPNALTQVPLSVKTTKGSCIPLGGSSFSCNLGSVSCGEVVKITADYTVPDDVSACDVRNVVDVQSTTFDGHLCNNEAHDTTAIVESATLDVHKVGHCGGEEPCQHLRLGDPDAHSYDIWVTNNGPSVARQVLLQDSWPFQFVQLKSTLDSSQGRCVTTGGDFQCFLGDIPSGQAVQVHIGFTLSELSPPGLISNVATISSQTDQECRFSRFNILVLERLITPAPTNQPTRSPTPAPTTITTSAPTTTPAPTSGSPTTPEPTTGAPTTSIPTTEAPTTDTPTTEAPTTDAPTALPPMLNDYSSKYVGQIEVYDSADCEEALIFSQTDDCQRAFGVLDFYTSIACSDDGQSAYVSTNLCQSSDSECTSCNSFTDQGIGPGFVTQLNSCTAIPNQGVSTILRCVPRPQLDTPAPTPAQAQRDVFSDTYAASGSLWFTSNTCSGPSSRSFDGDCTELFLGALSISTTASCSDDGKSAFIFTGLGTQSCGELSTLPIESNDGPGFLPVSDPASCIPLPIGCLYDVEPCVASVQVACIVRPEK